MEYSFGVSFLDVVIMEVKGMGFVLGIVIVFI